MAKGDVYKFSPSMLGKCERQLVYFKNETTKEKLPKQIILRSLRGTGCHKVIEDVFYASISGNGYGTYETVAVEEPIKNPDPFDEATPDLIVRYKPTNSLYVIDLKNYYKVPSVIPQHIALQVSAYMALIPNCSGGYVLFWPDFSLPAFKTVTPIGNVLEYAAEKKKRIEYYSSSGKLPDRLPYGSKECSFCHYRERCWSDIASELGLSDISNKEADRKEKELDLTEFLKEDVDKYIELNDLHKTITEKKAEIIKKLQKLGVSGGIVGSSHVKLRVTEGGTVSLHINQFLPTEKCELPDDND